MSDNQTDAGRAWGLSGLCISVILMGVCSWMPLIYRIFLRLAVDVGACNRHSMFKPLCDGVGQPICAENNLECRRAPGTSGGSECTLMTDTPDDHCSSVVVLTKIHAFRTNVGVIIGFLLSTAIVIVLNYYNTVLTDTATISCFALVVMCVSTLSIMSFETVLRQQDLIWVVDRQQRACRLYVRPWLHKLFLPSHIMLCSNVGTLLATPMSVACDDIVSIQRGTFQIPQRDMYSVTATLRNGYEIRMLYTDYDGSPPLTSSWLSAETVQDFCTKMTQLVRSLSPLPNPVPDGDLPSGAMDFPSAVSAQIPTSESLSSFRSVDDAGTQFAALHLRVERLEIVVSQLSRDTPTTVAQIDSSAPHEQEFGE